MDEIQADRLAALRRGGTEAVAALMERLPWLADAVAGNGPLTLRSGPGGYLWRSRAGSRINDLPALARLAASDLARRITMMSVNRIEYQLLGLAVWHGGVLSRHDVPAETEADPAVLDRAAAGLADLLLSDPERGWVALRPGVAEWVWLPGPTVRQGARAVTSKAIEQILANLEVEAGSRKEERVDAWEAAVRDGRVVTAAISRLSEEERGILSDLLTYGPSSTSDFGVAYYTEFGPRTPLHSLVSSGLVGVDPYERLCWVWLDVIVALQGALFLDWTTPSAQPRPLAVSGAASIPGVVGRLDQLLDLWEQAPPRALKSGGLGVTPIRAAAKALGTTSTEVGLLASLAIELGLVGSMVVGTRGRGRNQTVDEEWRPTAERADWQRRPAWERWARLVQQWLDSDQLGVTGKAVERYEWDVPTLNRPMIRHVYLRTLLRLEEGSGLDPDELADTLVFENWGLISPSIVGQLTEEARVLGLVPGAGPVGATPVARVFAAGTEHLEQVAATGSTSFTVQADHTVIAPPDLAADLVAILERFARLESDAGARTYRITEDALSRALATGTEAEEILAFLAAHSLVPVAQNVERSIRDAAARHGRLAIGTATTWLSCDDPVLLSRAVAVKAAKLELVAPTVAVSPLPTHRVHQALQAKGLAAVDRAEPTPAPKPERPRRATTVELRPRPVRSSEELRALAAAVAADPGPPPVEEPPIDWDGGLLRLLAEEES